MPAGLLNVNLNSPETTPPAIPFSAPPCARRGFADRPPQLIAPTPGIPLMHDLIPLAQMSSGTRGSVGAVLGLPDSVHRLKELGLSEGAEVEMIQSGSPCIVRLSGHKLCFRADELLSVLVRPRGVGAAG